MKNIYVHSIKQYTDWPLKIHNSLYVYYNINKQNPIIFTKFINILLLYGLEKQVLREAFSDIIKDYSLEENLVDLDNTLNLY